MASAGDVVINFAAETAKFRAEVKAMRAELKSLRESIEGPIESLKNFGTAIKGAFIAAGIVTGIKAIVKATEESEAAISQLDAALKNASSTVRLTSTDFQAFAKTMQATTTFTDEAVEGVETILLSFRSLSGQTILNATSAVLDLSTRLGTDLTSSAKLVGRALEDPVKGMTALARSGVVFSKSQQDLIKQLATTGEKAKAQGIILEELEKRYGGASVAARDTLGGALKALENQFGDLLEGDRNSFKSATTSINALTKALTDPKIKEGFDNLISALAATVSFAAKAAIALSNLGTVIGKGFGPADADLKASEALAKELHQAEVDLKLGLVDNVELAKAYIETLKQRIELAKQNEAAEKRVADQVARSGTLGGHGPIKRTDIPEPDFDATMAKLKAQEDVLEIRQKAITASINSAGAFLDSLDRQLGDGEHRLSELDKLTREQQAKSRADFAKDQLDVSVSEFDRRLKLEQEFTDRVVDEQRKRVESETRLQQDMVQVRSQAVFDSIGILSFLVAGHNKAYKAVAAVHKAFTLLQIYRDTAAAATLALRTYPPPFGYAAAAAAIGFGAIQAAAVLSDRQPRAGGRSGAFDTSSIVVSSTQTGIATQPIGSQQKPQSMINVYGWSEAAIRELVKVMKREIADHDLTIIRQP